MTQTLVSNDSHAIAYEVWVSELVQTRFLNDGRLEDRFNCGHRFEWTFIADSYFQLISSLTFNIICIISYLSPQ